MMFMMGNMPQRYHSYIEQHYHYYLRLLKELTHINTVYDNPVGIQEALHFCKAHFETSLSSWLTYFDSENNVICRSDKLDPQQPILYLSAHIDTVDANPASWQAPFQPFIPYEDDTELVGRGVNDCKAGVAYQLFLAHMISAQQSSAHNIIFTITSREENGGMSVKAIARELGSTLPLNDHTYWFTLENSVQVDTTPQQIGIFTSEPGSIGLQVTGSLLEIQRWLANDPNLWNPTNCQPNIPLNTTATSIQQIGGHACSSPRDTNALYQLIMQNTDLAIQAGDMQVVSVLPQTIQYQTATTPITHTVLCDLRTMLSIADLEAELRTHNINYTFTKQNDTGYDISDRLLQDTIYTHLLAVENPLNPKLTTNPGTTDSGRVYSICPSILPITCGPGTRSQRTATPPRLTHGMNETYHKTAGLQALQYITDVFERMHWMS